MVGMRVVNRCCVHALSTLSNQRSLRVHTECGTSFNSQQPSIALYCFPQPLLLTFEIRLIDQSNGQRLLTAVFHGRSYYLQTTITNHNPYCGEKTEFVSLTLEVIYKLMEDTKCVSSTIWIRRTFAHPPVRHETFFRIVKLKMNTGGLFEMDRSAGHLVIVDAGFPLYKAECAVQS